MRYLFALLPVLCLSGACAHKQQTTATLASKPAGAHVVAAAASGTLARNEAVVPPPAKAKAVKRAPKPDEPKSDSPASAGLVQALNLQVHVEQDGIWLVAANTRIGPGCSGVSVGEGLTIARTAAGYDYVALRSCARRLKEADSAYLNETRVHITMAPGLSYQTLIEVMDTLHGDPTRGDMKLFPDVTLDSVPKR